MDAAVYEPTPPCRPAQMGRSHLKGERLPNLSVVAEGSSTGWKPITVASWYGKQERTIEIYAKTAPRYSTGLSTVLLRWMLRSKTPGKVPTPGTSLPRSRHRAG